MLRPNNAQAEDAVTFGRRLRFIDLPYHGQQVLSWPCLWFSSITELLAVMGNRGMLADFHMLRRINIEHLLHLQQQQAPQQQQLQPTMCYQEGPVVFLFGHKTPGGRRILFPDIVSSPQQVRPYKDGLVDALDNMGHEPCFVDALQETSPILGNWLAQEMASPDRLPDPGEHAPAA